MHSYNGQVMVYTMSEDEKKIILITDLVDQRLRIGTRDRVL